MPVTVQVHRIDPARLDDWRQFIATITGPRRGEWGASRRRRGIRRAVISLIGTESDPMSVVLVDATDPAASSESLKSSDHEFDVWLRAQLTHLLSDAVPGEVLFDSMPRRGAWPGLRRPGIRP